MARHEWTPEERAAVGRRFREGRERAAARRTAAAQSQIELERRLVDEALAALPSVRPIAPLVVMKPLTWHDLPRDARKSARNPRVPDNAPVHKARCNNCRLEYWTRSDELEDICETCEFVLIDEKHRLRKTAERNRGGQLVNPFRQSEGQQRIVNPFSGSTKL